MTILDEFLACLSADQRQLLKNFKNPHDIQVYLDSILYSPENRNRSPLNVLNDRMAHCLDGGLMAAAALRLQGFPPLLIDILPEPGTDDDHILAIFKIDGYIGAVAKSNYVGLRFREAVYRTYRELVLSYFEDFYSVDGIKTMRAYTLPLDVSRLDHVNWMCDDAGVDVIEQHILRLRRFPLFDQRVAERLSLIDPLGFQAGRLDVNEAGLYYPQKTD